MAEFSTKENAFAASDENQETNINHYTTTELVSILNLSNLRMKEILKWQIFLMMLKLNY